MRTWVYALILVLSAQASAQVEVHDEVDPRTAPSERPAPVKKPEEAPLTPVGKKQADTYFKARQAPAAKREVAATNADRYLMLMIGGFWNQDTYKWGCACNEDIAKFTAGVTYRIGEWVGSMDLMIRGDLTTYSLHEGKALKLGLMPLIVFPDASSRFPMYFGGGVGPGIFFKQIRNESSVALDYEIFAGARFFDLWENVGFVFEAGLKNSVLLFSDGQLNTVYTTAGAVFTF